VMMLFSVASVRVFSSSVRQRSNARSTYVLSDGGHCPSEGPLAPPVLPGGADLGCGGCGGSCCCCCICGGGGGSFCGAVQTYRRSQKQARGEEEEGKGMSNGPGAGEVAVGWPAKPADTTAGPRWVQAAPCWGICRLLFPLHLPPLQNRQWMCGPQRQRERERRRDGR
jgi:hypothetical protein